MTVPSSGLRVHLLGGFRVFAGDRPVLEETWRSRRAAAIVKLLALAPGHQLHRERVMDALWPDLDLDAQANNLNVAVSRARAALASAGARPGAFLIRVGELLTLGDPERIRVDVDLFEQTLADGWRSGDPASFQAALTHYTGDLLPEDPYEDWAADRRTALRTSYLALLSRLGQLHTERGETGYAIETYQRLLAADPAQEEVYAALMRIHAADGQRGPALALYDRLIAVLKRDLDTVPEAATIELAQSIRDGRYALAPVPVVSAPPATLPAPVSELVGREREIAEIRQLLAVGRLVTLTGPGGIGKTRLAIAVAHEVGESFPAGAFFVDLSSIRDPDVVSTAIARTLDLREQGGGSPLDGLRRFLRDRRLLLVLDNFEQVLDAAPVVTMLLEHAPHLRTVVTSRVGLRLRGEREYPVLPLPLPDLRQIRPGEEVVDSAAVRLFVLRARDVKPDFGVSREHAPTIVEICRQLDGLPLAIELAAARAKVLTPPAMLARLDRPLTLLVGGARDLPPRQQTIRDTIAWSFGLLNPEEQTLFRRLAVFAGGWTLEAAEAVCGREAGGGSRWAEGTASSPAFRLPPSASVFDGIASLVDKSLVVQRETSGGAGDARFGMLETIRDYGLEQLAASGEEAEVRGRHAAWCLALAEEAEPWLEGFGGEQGRWLARLDAELGNLRAALAWFHDTGDSARLLRLAGILDVFWFTRPYFAEARRWLELGLAGGAQAPADIRGMALHVLVSAACYLGDHPTGVARGEEELALARTMDGPFPLGRAHYGLGLAWSIAGEVERAAAHFAEAVPLLRQAEASSWIYLALAELGDMLHLRGDVDAAVSVLDEALVLVQQVNRDQPFALQDRLSVARVRARRAHAARSQGDHAFAARLFVESLTTAREESDDRQVAGAVAGLAGIALDLGQPARAARLLGAVARALEAAGFGRSSTDLHLSRIQAAACEHLGESAFADAFETGQEMPLTEAVADAFAIARSTEGES